MACSGDVKVTLKKWKNQIPTSNDKADVLLRVTLGNKVLIEGEKLQPKQDGEGPPNKLGSIDEGEDAHLSVGGPTPDGTDPRPRANSKSDDKKDKSGGGKGKGGGKAAKGQGGVSGPAAVRLWEVNQEVCLSYDKSSSNVLSEVIMHPLLISFTEVQPKDKKHKDEKTRLLCQTTLDLLPYVMGSSSSDSVATPPRGHGHDTCELTMHPCLNVEGNAYLLNILSEDKKSTLELEVTAHSDFRMTESNVLTMRLRSLHSLPDTLQHMTSSYTYTASLPLSSSPSPTFSAPPISFLFPQGMLQPAPSKDHASLPTHWKWPGTVQSTEAAKATKLEAQPLEAESGAWHSREVAGWRESVEGDRPRVSWNTMQRVWLSHESNMALTTQLSKNALVPLEIGRFTIPPAAGAGSRMATKKNADSEPVLSYHGVAYLDLSPLLYPGTCVVCGAFPVYAYKDADVKAKTGTSQPPTLGLASDLEDTGKKTGASKPNSSVAPPGNNEAGSGDEGAGPPAEGTKTVVDAYEEAKTYVFLELQLDTPLIPKRPMSILATRVKSYVPSRSALPSYEGGVEHVVAQFQDHTSSLASQLVMEYRRVCAQDDNDSAEEQQRKFIYYLNSTGKYQGLKEDLKRSVVKIVREKYLSEIPGPEDRLQMHKFLSQLYIFLVDKMHAGLKKAFSIVGSPPSVPSPLTSDLFKLFAFEAESAKDYELAEHYHKQRVSLTEQSSCEVWYDYGVFCYLISNYDRAEQCLREAVCKDSTNIPAVLLLGVSCCLAEKYSEAEDLFELATTSDPKHVVAWTMRGLYYEVVGNKLMQEMCFQDAIRCTEDPDHKTFLAIPSSHTSIATKSHLSSTKHPSTSSKVSVMSSKPGNLGMPSAASMQSKGMSRDVSGELGAEGGGDKGVARGDNRSGSPTATGGLGIVGDVVGPGGLSATNAPRNNSNNPDPQNGPGGDRAGGLAERSAATIKSEINLTEESPGNGPGEGEGPLAATPTATPTGIFLQTTSYLVDIHALKFADISLAHALTSLMGGHEKCYSYLMAEGRLRMYREQYEEALACIKQAIVINIQECEPWALLGHTQFLSGDEQEAMKSYERTLDYVQSPRNIHLVYIRLAQLYISHKMYSKAKNTYLRACSHTPSALTWRGVGVACYRLGEYEEAEEALCEANILNNQDPQVWGYLALVCLQAKRPVEAEQALKFAIKTGLSDEELFAELREVHKKCTPDVDIVHLPQATAPSHA